MKQWRSLVDFAQQNSRYTLTIEELNRYLDLSLERMIRILRNENDPEILSLDPTGKDRLKFVKSKRRSMSRLIRHGKIPPKPLPQLADQFYFHQ